MSGMSPFASPGARAEHYAVGFGRLADSLGRVIRERMGHLRRTRVPSGIPTRAMVGRPIS